MIDLIFSLSTQVSQVQIVAQSPSYYLPISTTQSTRPNCVIYTATNTTGSPIREVYVNRRDSEGDIIQYPLWREYSNGILKNGGTVSFDLCDNSFVNVEAKR